VDAQRELTARHNYTTLKAAVNAFNKRGRQAVQTPVD
jgi:hypothetical protein